MDAYFVKVSACVSRNTFKYFFPNALKGNAIWDVLVRRYGTPQLNAFFEIEEIISEKFTFRTTFSHNPLTIIVKGDLDEEFMNIHKTILRDE